MDDDSRGRESKRGGNEATEGDGGGLGRHPPAAHGLLQQAAPHSENLVGDAHLCQTHACPQNKVCCTPCSVPNSSVTHLISQGQETGARPLHQASTCGIIAVNKTDANKVLLFFHRDGQKSKQEAQTRKNPTKIWAIHTAKQNLAPERSEEPGS